MILIHPGKTAGTTLRQTFTFSQVYHIAPCPKIIAETTLEPIVVPVRDPIDRIISAYHWRKRVSEQPEERLIFQMYPTIDQWACALNEWTTNIGHIHNTSYRFHLSHLPFNKLTVIRTEEFERDTQSIFGYTPKYQANVNAKKEHNVCEETRQRIADYFHEEIALYQSFLKYLALSNG